jgi:hypothetical protein
MKFYVLDPEVAGGWGPNTKFTRVPGKPLVIHTMDYEFDDWLGDELLQTDPVFIVTQRLADRLQARGLNGYFLKPVEVSKSEEFLDNCGNKELPEFAWLDIVGKAGGDDFGIHTDGRLVVSKTALDVIKTTQLDHCEVEEFS